MSAHILAFGIALKVITDKAVCQIAYYIVGTVLSFLLCLPRRMVEISWISFVSMLSILAAVIATMVGVSITHGKGGGGSTYVVTHGTGLVDSMVALLDIVLAYCKSLSSRLLSYITKNAFST